MRNDTSRQEQIRKVFVDIEGACIPRLTRECMDRGIWNDDEIRNAAFRTFQREVKDALKITNPVTMLPWALETTKVDKNDKSGARRWDQLSLLDYDDLAFNITKRVKGIQDDYDKIVRLQSYCIERFGKSPPIPLLVNEPFVETDVETDTVQDQPEEIH